MAEHDFAQRTIINGCEPVTVTDIECLAHITCEQAEAMGAMFRSIARLTEDKEIRELCAHGGLQANLQGNDIDVIRERAMKAGLAIEGVKS
jgi:hypothetical protein